MSLSIDTIFFGKPNWRQRDPASPLPPQTTLARGVLRNHARENLGASLV